MAEPEKVELSKVIAWRTEPYIQMREDLGPAIIRYGVAAYVEADGVHGWVHVIDAVGELRLFPTRVGADSWIAARKPYP